MTDLCANVNISSMNIKLKRIALDVMAKDHKRIKEFAARQGMSIKRLMLKSIALYMKTFGEEPTQIE